MKTIYSFVAALLMVITVAPLATKANTINGKEIVALTAKQVSVQYAGSKEDSKVFHVTFDNPEAQKFSLIIKNDEGDVIYQGQFSDVHFSKSIHLLSEEAEMNPTFIIRVGDQKSVHTFKANSNAGGYTEEVTAGK